MSKFVECYRITSPTAIRSLIVWHNGRSVEDVLSLLSINPASVTVTHQVVPRSALEECEELKLDDVKECCREAGF